MVAAAEISFGADFGDTIAEHLVAVVSQVRSLRVQHHPLRPRRRALHASLASRQVPLVLRTPWHCCGSTARVCALPQKQSPKPSRFGRARVHPGETVPSDNLPGADSGAPVAPTSPAADDGGGEEGAGIGIDVGKGTDRDGAGGGGPTSVGVHGEDSLAGADKESQFQAFLLRVKSGTEAAVDEVLGKKVGAACLYLMKLHSDNLLMTT
jgi:hypothetical protein